ncbi:MAG: hypothetical protein Q4B48_03525 [Syntrophomonadaceae bacterium]|nr:hypothetical protein [Syntrophomonadaceae bacterium]
MSQPQRSRSTLFLMELILAVIIFTVCCAICVGLFLRANALANDSTTLNHAVFAAESCAEAFRADALKNYDAADDTYIVIYDHEWQVIDQGSDAYAADGVGEGSGRQHGLPLECEAYVRMTFEQQDFVHKAHIAVYTQDGDVVFELNAAKYVPGGHGI